MDYYLIETWQPDIILPKHCKAVALTIEASYQLNRSGIDYLTLEDFYTHGEICSDEESFLVSQLSWFKEFDTFVQEIYPEAKKSGLNLPSLYFYNIKALVDQVILTSKIIKRFIDAVNPSKIWFISQVFDDEKIYRWLWFYYGESIFARLINPICKEKGIPIEKITLKQNQAPNLNINHARILLENLSLKQKLIKLSKKVLPPRLKNFVLVGRQLYHQIQCYCTWPFKRKHNKGNLLIIKGKDYIYDFCKDANRYGFKLFFKHGRFLWKQQFPIPWGKKIHPIRNHEKSKLREDVSPDVVMNDICNGKIMNWINKECGFNVAPILFSRFSYLICDLFPKTISLIQKFHELYATLKIDYVINCSLSSEEDFAAAAATRIGNRTKSVGFFHGMDAFEARQRYFMENYHFDLYFASTAGDVKHIREQAQFFGNSHPIVNEFPYLRNRIKIIETKKRQKKRDSIDKLPIVLYVPIMRKSRPNMMIDKSFPLTMAYLKWHQSLINYFSSRTDFHFVWKALLQPIFGYDTIPQILKDKKCKNISFHTGNLYKWFPKVDKVLCDVPSTAFFEACFVGLPTMALYRPEDQALRKNAYESFGNSLRPYSSTGEGIKVVEEFLDGNPQDYIVSIDKPNASVIDILSENLSERWP